MTSPLTNNGVWTIGVSTAGNNVNVNFLRLANRGFLVQSSPDLSSWTTWDVPGNQLIFGETNQPVSISGPLLPTSQYFRVRIFEP
jgi:hypothetical protein